MPRSDEAHSDGARIEQAVEVASAAQVYTEGVTATADAYRTYLDRDEEDKETR